MSRRWATYRGRNFWTDGYAAWEMRGDPPEGEPLRIEQALRKARESCGKRPHPVHPESFLGKPATIQDPSGDERTLHIWRRDDDGLVVLVDHRYAARVKGATKWVQYGNTFGVLVAYGTGGRVVGVLMPVLLGNGRNKFGADQ